MKSITILGSTGSIGQSTLDLIQQHRERFEVVGLTANTNLERLYEQCVCFRPKFVVIGQKEQAQILERRLSNICPSTRVFCGEEGLNEVAKVEVDIVVAAIVGAAGLKPTINALTACKRLLLANKEALVMGGQFFMEQVSSHNVELLPIDSEHNALFQCMSTQGEHQSKEIKKLILTASGGPFWQWPKERLLTVTPAEAVKHPNWSMGQKISVDSATMMNKGLEVIEAKWLFSMDVSKIDVVIHPDSIIHSMVEYIDGSILAQMGNPDMRTPIAHALAFPSRVESGVKPLDFSAGLKLEFHPLDYDKFHCLRLALNSLEASNGASVVLNAANEIAVEAFLNHRIRFLAIPSVIETALEQFSHVTVNDLDEVILLDKEVRAFLADVVMKKIQEG